MAGAIYSTSKLWKARVQVTPDTSGNMVSVVPSAPTPAPTPLDPAQAPAQDPAQAAAQDPAQAPAQDPDEAPAQVPRVPSAPDQAPDQDPAKAPCPTKSWTSTQAPAQFQGYRPIQLQKDKVNSQNEVVASAQKRDREVVAVPVSELPGVVTSSQNYSQLPKVAQEDGKISKHAPTPAGNQESRIQASQGAGAESLAEPVSCQPKHVYKMCDLPDKIEDMEVKSVAHRSEDLESASVEVASFHHRPATTTEGGGESVFADAALEQIADLLDPLVYLERAEKLRGIEKEPSCSESEAESSCEETSSVEDPEAPASDAGCRLVEAASAGNSGAVNLHDRADSAGLSSDSVWQSSLLCLSASFSDRNEFSEHASDDDTDTRPGFARSTATQTSVTHQHYVADCMECRAARPPNHFVHKNSRLKAMEGTWQLVAGRTHCGFEVINITIGVAAVIMFDRLGVSYRLSVDEQQNLFCAKLGHFEIQEGYLHTSIGRCTYQKRPCDLHFASPDCNSQDSFLASGCRPAHLDTGGQHSMKSSSIQTDSWMVLDGFSPDWAVCCRSRCCLQCAGLNALSHQALDFGVLDGFWQLQADQHNDEDDYRYLRVVGRWVIANNGTWNYLRDSCGQVLLQNCVLGHRHASLCWFRKTRRKLYCRATLADREEDCNFAAFDIVTRSALATLSSSTFSLQATRTCASMLGTWSVMPEHENLARKRYTSLWIMSDQRQRTSKSKSTSKHAYIVRDAVGGRCVLKVNKKQPTTLNRKPIWWDDTRLFWLSSEGQLMIYKKVR
eukprot:TRINITY_DN9707_c1_g1_i4.p1 TRINITY_DN9707_c1_g1~~TRINITY_DN9707_c1_g1_i4.p1  ORF type:complete len:851 (-),score=110.52 TRINITY_DN9707_c1_g1_i4:149-2500(-)